MNNCPNCGAPLSGFECKYCGAIFYDFASLSFDKPIFLKIKTPKGDVITAKTMLTRCELEIDKNEQTLYCDNRVEHVISNPEMTIQTQFMLRGGEKP